MLSCVFFLCVFLPGWLIGFGKSQDVKQSLINMAKPLNYSIPPPQVQVHGRKQIVLGANKCFFTLILPILPWNVTIIKANYILNMNADEMFFQKCLPSSHLLIFTKFNSFILKIYSSQITSFYSHWSYFIQITDNQFPSHF